MNHLSAGLGRRAPARPGKSRIRAPPSNTFRFGRRMKMETPSRPPLMMLTVDKLK